MTDHSKLSWQERGSKPPTPTMTAQGALSRLFEAASHVPGSAGFSGNAAMLTLRDALDEAKRTIDDIAKASATGWTPGGGRPLPASALNKYGVGNIHARAFRMVRQLEPDASDPKDHISVSVDSLVRHLVCFAREEYARVYTSDLMPPAAPTPPPPFSPPPAAPFSPPPAAPFSPPPPSTIEDRALLELKRTFWNNSPLGSSDFPNASVLVPMLTRFAKDELTRFAKDAMERYSGPKS